MPRSRLRPAALALAAVAAGAWLAPAPDGGAQQPSAAERVAAARERLAAINARADRLGDVDAIENLQRAYGYYVDKMLWDHAVDLFAEGATLERGPSGVYEGRASIREYLYSLSDGEAGPIEGELYNHMQLQPIITVSDDGTSARGRWHTLILTGTYGGGSGGRWGAGVYENEYVKEDGVWKISTLHLYPTFIAPYEGGWLEVDADDIREHTMGRGVEPDAPPSDPGYALYPAADVVPFHYTHPVTSEPVDAPRD